MCITHKFNFNRNHDFLSGFTQCSCLRERLKNACTVYLFERKTGCCPIKIYFKEKAKIMF